MFRGANKSSRPTLLQGFNRFGESALLRFAEQLMNVRRLDHITVDGKVEIQAHPLQRPPSTYSESFECFFTSFPISRPDRKRHEHTGIDLEGRCGVVQGDRQKGSRGQRDRCKLTTIHSALPLFPIHEWCVRHLEDELTHSPLSRSGKPDCATATGNTCLAMLLGKTSDRAECDDSPTLASRRHLDWSPLCRQA